jgi:signal transduction histidine kinase
MPRSRAHRRGTHADESHRRSAASRRTAAAGEEFGLAPALRWYAAEFEHRTGLKASVASASGERRLPPQLELALFRIAQEALTNAAKHSGGTSVQVALSESDGRIRLSVEDDVLVTATGHDLLSSKAPRSPDDIEKTMKAGKRGK